MTSMPMLRAVPAMMRMPASSLRVQVLLLQVVDLEQLLPVDLADLVLVGRAEPLAMLAAFLRRTDAGGDFRMNVKLLSEKTVMTTGRIIPFWSLVLALNSLQNAMMLTPWAPSAGPTGGAGFAAPAGSWSRM
jgi:hypothetical protein